MIEGPTLKEGQFALLMCDGATGHVLTTEGEVYLSTKGSVYLVFEGITSVRKYIKTTQEENNTVEFSIYDHKYELVEFYKALKWV
ncbi:hypothetical protein EXU57_08820 [Segetibacter sp. 3557_3]|uniref:hypothetical protein n=1 Tax=Segetibacter sp. 3557_3 TaxID=2547429 RepID=UPI001058E2AA|nr:hypothetical protein [Segetibacter sp. 3557_3]TDH26898.1 hypothetical protein EXU57_08820 [Segetibacter sp. 3557_3]